MFLKRRISYDFVLNPTHWISPFFLGSVKMAQVDGKSYGMQQIQVSAAQRVGGILPVSLPVPKHALCPAHARELR